MSPRLQAARLAEKCTRFAARRFPSLTPAANGLPLGFLRSHDIDAYVSETYSAAPDFYNPDVYRFHYEKAFCQEIRKHTRGNKLLDLYCGQGREAEIFSVDGFDVLGVDRMENSIGIAKQNAADVGSNSTFLCADIDRWTPGVDPEWDIVYTSLWMLSTVPDRQNRIAWLQRFSPWVRDGGIFFASVTTAPTHRSGRASRFANLSRLASFNSRKIEAGDRLTNGLFWHDYAPGEIEQDAAEAGLSLVASFPFRDDSMALIFRPTR